MMAEASSPQRAVGRYRVAIIGGGPSGFYAAEALLRSGQAIDVDMFERLPVPYGLVRFGVAPDHPKLKQVTRIFDRIADMPGFRFFGGVEIGETPSISALRSCYHALILATGAPVSRLMDVPGEGLPGSYQASDFVAWYNGHPDFRHCKFDLGAERAVIIGHGNVALDVARILAKTPDELRHTDIAAHALDALRPVAFGRSIWLDGAARIRRALPQRSCRNLRSLPIVIRWSNWTAFQSSLQALVRTPRQRLRSLCFGILDATVAKRRRCVFLFGLAPVGIEGDESRPANSV